MTLWLKDDGTIEYLGHHNLDDLGLEVEEVQRRRVSLILPVNPFLRALFILLRRTFGETGSVADWTRTWTCQWRVTSQLLPVEFQHTDRGVCERWERDELEKRETV